MDVELFEQKLRALPGVLDCSVSTEGVAVVVHPEVDPRLVELQAQILLGEAGDRRPLLVVGGMTVGPRVLPSGRPVGALRPRRNGLSPVSLVGLALLVLALLAVVPIAGRDGAGSRSDVAAPEGRAGGSGRVPVREGERPSGSQPALGPAAPAAGSVAAAFREGGGSSSSSGVRLASAPITPEPAAVVIPSSPRSVEPTVRPAKKGGGRVQVALSAPTSPPGKASPPGRRLARGHSR